MPPTSRCPQAKQDIEQDFRIDGVEMKETNEWNGLHMNLALFVAGFLLMGSLAVIGDHLATNTPVRVVGVASSEEIATWVQGELCEEVESIDLRDPAV